MVFLITNLTSGATLLLIKFLHFIFKPGEEKIQESG